MFWLWRFLRICFRLACIGLRFRSRYFHQRRWFQSTFITNKLLLHWRWFFLLHLHRQRIPWWLWFRRQFEFTFHWQLVWWPFSIILSDCGYVQVIIIKDYFPIWWLNIKFFSYEESINKICLKIETNGFLFELWKFISMFLIWLFNKIKKRVWGSRLGFDIGK